MSLDDPDYRATKARLDAELRALPAHEKHILRKAGFKGDLSPLPPGENSGRMQTTGVRTKAGHYIERRDGDPRIWMEQFMPPVKHTVVAIRTNESEHEWQQKSLDRRTNISKYGSPSAPSQAEFDQAWQKTQNR